MRPGAYFGAVAVVAAAVCGNAAAALSGYPPLRASGAVVARCDLSMRGEGIPSRQSPTKAVGDFGIFEFSPEHRELRRFGNSLLRDKAPVGIRGDVPVTVSVPELMRHRVALSYGRSGRFAEVRFEPCSHKARTAWPGGLTLRDRQPVKLMVAIGEGAPQPLWLGRR